MLGRPGNVECLTLKNTRDTRDISLRNDHGLHKFVPCRPPTHSDASLRNMNVDRLEAGVEKHLKTPQSVHCCGDLSGLVGC
jgi:hypothetical protein